MSFELIATIEVELVMNIPLVTPDATEDPLDIFAIILVEIETELPEV
jgi:hypothetical protein